MKTLPQCALEKYLCRPKWAVRKHLCRPNWAVKKHFGRPKWAVKKVVFFEIKNKHVKNIEKTTFIFRFQKRSVFSRPIWGDRKVFSRPMSDGRNVFSRPNLDDRNVFPRPILDDINNFPRHISAMFSRQDLASPNMVFAANIWKAKQHLPGCFYGSSSKLV